MPLRDPVAVYNAASNLEALFIRDALVAAGVEAFVIEDVSQVGTWVGGLVSEIHKPQVWVERSNIARAKPVLDAFERRAADLRNPNPDNAGGATIATVCEECGARASFPAVQRGSVQRCPKCKAYVDVGGDEADRSEQGDADSVANS